MKLYYSILFVVFGLTALMTINYLATSSEAAREFALVGIIIGISMILIERTVSLWRK
jgi:hypothetical protein